MLLAITGRTRAERTAAEAVAVARRRADNEWPHDWTEHRSYSDYVTVLRSMEAEVDGPDWAPVVHVWPRLRPTGDYWLNLASEALDAAAGRVDEDAGDDFTFRRGTIETDPATYGAKLTWTPKPNLERAFGDDEDVPGPMVALVLDGRTYYLDAWAQGTAADVAAWWPDRDRLDMAARYQRSLATLAADLGTDEDTAVRVAELAVPNRDWVNGVDVERNEDVRILSAQQELAVIGRSKTAALRARNGCVECGAEPGQPCVVENCQGEWR